MEIIRELVQSIAVIVVLAVFLEMLLPLGGMRRYLRLVFGILVMIAVLQAVFSLAGRGSTVLDLPPVIVPYEDRSDLPGQLQDIIDEGNKLRNNRQQKAVEEYKEGLAKQISSLAGLNGLVNVAGVQVVVEDDKQSPYYGRLKEVYLEVASGECQEKPEIKGGEEKGGIEPVKIQIGEQKDNGECISGLTEQEDSVAVSRIIKSIAGFYNLPQESVKVIYR